MAGAGTRTSTRPKVASDKRKHEDEGSNEVLLKKFKALEDKLKTSNDSNKALMAEVKTLKRKPAPVQVADDSNKSRDNSGESSSDDGSDSDIARKSDDPNFLFQSRKITVKSREDPDKAKRKGRSRGKGDRGQFPQHQDPSPTRDAPESEHINDPVSDSAPPPREPSRMLPTASRDVTIPPAITPPAHPWPPAPLAPGVDPKTPKTANKVYENIVATLLNEAQHKFESLLFTEHAYPGLDAQIRWSTECWEAVCAGSQRYFELSKEMRNLIKGRCSHGRGAILQRVRPVIEALFNMNVAKPSVVRNNTATASKLLAGNAFYFVNGVPGNRRFENATFLRALQRSFFGGPKSPAATDQANFDPVPLPSIALVSTIIEHCLREWETGRHVPVNLDEATDGVRYHTHLANAVSWQSLNREATTRIREHLSKKLFTSCGLKSKEVATTSSISQKTLDDEKAALDLGRVFEPDSDPEDGN